MISEYHQLHLLQFQFKVCDLAHSSYLTTAERVCHGAERTVLQNKLLNAVGLLRAAAWCLQCAGCCCAVGYGKIATYLLKIYIYRLYIYAHIR